MVAVNWHRVILGMTEPSTSDSLERFQNPVIQSTEKVAKMKVCNTD